MELGLIGLGKMGLKMKERLENKGHNVIGFDIKSELSTASSLNDLVNRLKKPRVIWIMVPAGEITQSVINELMEVLDPGDLVIEGGNSKYTEDIKNSNLLSAKGIKYLDCGVSGGIWGRENGYALMVGGDKEDIQRALPIFDALIPEGERELSFVHAGKVGAGHYSKMIHNGIEYGLMQAFAEGYELLKSNNQIEDVAKVFKAWSKGTVIRSWLLDLIILALEEDDNLSQIADYVEDSGEGKWTVMEAINNAIPTPVISAALFARFSSRQSNSPAMKLVAALRKQFGGHEVKRS